MDRDRLYDDEEVDVVPQTPDVSRKESAAKSSTSKGQGSQKEVDGANTLSVDGRHFNMQYVVKLSTPHIILAEVIF